MKLFTRAAATLGTLAIAVGLCAPGVAGAKSYYPTVIEAPSIIAVDQAGVNPEAEFIFCTLAAIGWTKDTDIPRGITAGHCAPMTVASEKRKVYHATGTTIDDIDFSRPIGTVIDRTGKSDEARDAALIEFFDYVGVTSKVSLDGAPPVPIRGVIPVSEMNRLPDLILCSQGATSGFHCGDRRKDAPASKESFSATIPSRPGDSGAGVFALTQSGLYLVGLLTASNGENSPIGVGTPMATIVDRFGLTWDRNNA